MPRPSKRTVLETLTKARLFDLDRFFGLSTARSKSKTVFVEALARSRRAGFERVLGRLGRTDLLAICRKNDLDRSGSDKEIIERILGRPGAANPKTRKKAVFRGGPAHSKAKRRVPKAGLRDLLPDGDAPSAGASHLAKLEVKAFKSLESVSVEFGQINVFVGANGSGKSCLLEAIGILGACAAGIVDDQALLRRGVRPGVPELYKSSFSGKRLQPKISLRADSTDGAAYQAYITNSTDNPFPFWLFGNETLSYNGDVCASRGPSGKATSMSLSVALENTRSVTTLARANSELPAPVRSFLTTLDDFAIFAPVTPVLRGIIPDNAPRAPVGLYGGQLAEAIGLLATQDRGREVISGALTLIDWAKAITTKEPSRHLLSPSVPTTRYVVEFRDRYMAASRNALSGYDASEGALYILFMLVLAVHARSPSMFAVDNFDQALNPRAARALTKLFCDEAILSGRQVFLTTHNPLVLDGLNLGDDRIRLFTVARTGEGHTRVRRVPVRDFANLTKKHGEFAVSRMWIEGRLGGMPNV